MGSSSPYTNSPTWLTISKSSTKELIQNKQTKTVIEKHFLLFSDHEQIKKQNLIFEWRNNKKYYNQLIQIYQLRFEDDVQQSQSCNYSLCHSTPKSTKLTIFTQQLIKLDCYNPQIILTQTEQVKIIYQITQAILLLSHKFGHFFINKQMIGYNSQKIGKAWMHQNFACNYVQMKVKVSNQQEQKQWEANIIENIIKICNLGKNNEYSKFYDATLQIKQNKIKTFVQLSDFYQQKNVKSDKRSYEKQIEQRILHKDQFSQRLTLSPNHDCNLIHSKQQNESSTKVNQKLIVSKPMHHYNLIPVVSRRTVYPLSEVDKLHIRNTYHHPNIYSKRIVSSTSSRNSHEDINYVQVSHPFSQSIGYPQQKNIKDSHNFIQQINLHNLQNIIQEDEHRQSQRQDNIQMVDSMIMVQQELEEDQFQHKPQSKIILEQSVILRGNYP